MPRYQQSAALSNLYYRHTDKFDASVLIPDSLWQGSAPMMGGDLASRGFNMLVLCAEEIQPPARRFPGIEVVYAPMDDGDFVPHAIAQPAAIKVARAMAAGKRVLVTCAMGLNRSGLVSALALWHSTGRSGAECVDLIQAARRSALCNRTFERYLRVLPAQRLRARKQRQPQQLDLPKALVIR